MTDDNTDMAEEMSISEQQAKSPGISDWVSVKEIGAKQDMSAPPTASSQDASEE
jgi:hypothetical protein